MLKAEPTTPRAIITLRRLQILSRKENGRKGRRKRKKSRKNNMEETVSKGSLNQEGGNLSKGTVAESQHYRADDTGNQKAKAELPAFLPIRGPSQAGTENKELHLRQRQREGMATAPQGEPHTLGSDDVLLSFPFLLR